MGGSGSGYASRIGLTKDELKKRHRQEDSDAYLFDVEYEKLKKEQEKLEREYERARAEYVRITQELREEMANGTASQSDMARFMSALTDRGVQLQKEQKEMQDSIDKLNEQRTDLNKQMDDLRKKAFSGSTDAYKNATRDYQGFKNDYSGKRYANAKIVEMSPEEYLRRVAFDLKGTGMKELINNASPSVVAKYMRQMLRGTRFAAPSLNYKSGNAVGNERALAALLNGTGRIPVMIIE